MSNNHYFLLGASLYTPCTHPSLGAIMQNGLGARSMVFCTEDSVNASELEMALYNLKSSLERLAPHSGFMRFIRPRNAKVLRQILQMPGIEKIDGFVLPKADADTLPGYQRALAQHRKAFWLLPTLETVSVLEPAKLPQLREALTPLKEQILCLRIGGNDLMNLIGLKRQPGLTAYDTPLRTVIEQLIIAFRPYGYELSAPVFDFIDDRTTLAAEVARDISYGMYAKTAIHPDQLSIIEEQYTSYSELHLNQAQAVASKQASAVFKHNGQMMERTCHSNWAHRTLALAASRDTDNLSVANG